MSDSIDPSGIVWYLGLAFACLGVYWVASRAAAKWAQTNTYHRLAWALSCLPLASIAVATALFVRIRMHYGEWAYWDSSFGYDDYHPQRHSEGFESHFALAELLYLAALCSVAICGPFLLGHLKHRKQALNPTLLFGISWIGLIGLRYIDPGNQFAWLLPR